MTVSSTKKGKPKKRVRFERGIVPIVRAACHRSAQKGYLLVWFACVAVHCVIILVIESAAALYRRLSGQIPSRSKKESRTGARPASRQEPSRLRQIRRSHLSLVRAQMSATNNEGLAAFLGKLWESWPMVLTFECNVSGEEDAKPAVCKVYLEKDDDAREVVAAAACHRIAERWKLPEVLTAKNPALCMMAYIQIERDVQNWVRYQKLSRAFESVRIRFPPAHRSSASNAAIDYYKQRCHRVRHLENTMEKEEFEALAKMEREEEASYNKFISSRVRSLDAGEAAPLLERRERRKRMREDQEREEEEQGESSAPAEKRPTSPAYAPTSPSYSPTAPPYSVPEQPL